MDNDDNIVEELKKTPFFCNLNDKELSEIAFFCKIKKYVTNEFIFQQGEESADFFIVLSGSVTISLELNSCENIIIGELTKNDSSMRPSTVG